MQCGQLKKHHQKAKEQTVLFCWLLWVMGLKYEKHINLHFLNSYRQKSVKKPNFKEWNFLHRKKRKNHQNKWEPLWAANKQKLIQLIHRYYTKWNWNPGFNKRVTSFDIAPLEFHQKKHYAVVKYCGVFQSIAMGHRKANAMKTKNLSH